jgi:class 3 adenylate cyclase
VIAAALSDRLNGEGGLPMTFDEVLAQVMELLQREGRVAYRALKRRFTLDDEYLEDLKADLIDAKRVAVDEDGKVLVWTGAASVSSSKFQVSGPQSPDSGPRMLDAGLSSGERRQLTVMFCDLVGSTALSEQLDPGGPAFRGRFLTRLEASRASL